MQGMKFLIIDAQGKPFNHGTIIRELTPTKYVCQFTRIPSSVRTVDIAEVETWHLFPNDDLLNEFIVALKPKPGKVTEVKKKAAKKKKKVAKKKAK